MNVHFNRLTQAKEAFKYLTKTRKGEMQAGIFFYLKTNSPVALYQRPYVSLCICSRPTLTTYPIPSSFSVCCLSLLFEEVEPTDCIAIAICYLFGPG